MAEIVIKQTGINPHSGAEIYALKIDGEITGTDLSKLDVVMKAALQLGLPIELLSDLHKEIDKGLTS